MKIKIHPCNLNDNLMMILNRLVSKTEEVYLVGGCVRDLIMEKQPHDFDVVTNLHPDKIVELFKDRNVDLVGKSFGVVVADNVEIATFRKDVYSAEKLHTKGADFVEFASTIEEDLSRRDLTINSMALKYKFIDRLTYDFYELIDPFSGYDDLQKGIIKFVGNPIERIKEDPCRILRAIRFAYSFNKTFFFDEDTYGAIYKERAKYFLISPERVRLELMKAFERTNEPMLFVLRLQDFDLLQYIFPQLAICEGIDQNKYHAEDVLQHCLLACDAVSKKYPLIRLTALLHDVGKAQTKELGEDGEYHFYCHEMISGMLATRMLAPLKFSNKEIDYVYDLITHHMFYFEDITKNSTYRRFMSQLKVPVRDLLRLRIADRRGNLAKSNRPTITHMFKKTLLRIRQIEKEDSCLKVGDLKLDGSDLIALGLKPGPIFKEILQACLEVVIEDPSKNTKYELMKVLAEKYPLVIMKNADELFGGKII